MTLGTTSKRWLALLAIGAIVASAALGAACSDDDDDGDGDPAGGISPAATQPAAEATEPAAESTAAGDATEPAGEATEPAASGDLTLTTAEDETLGTILVDGRGFTLYTFANDTAGSGESACNEGCVGAWPPLTVEGEGSYDEALAADVDTITRADGSTQVTYKGMPLYFFASDTAPGDTTGHEVGGVWFVATP